MNKFFFLLLAFDTLCVSAQTIYVSSSIGDDNNDGLTMDKPIKDVKKALEKGNAILLKAGDTFYCAGLTITDKNLSRWGVGNNPTICGFRKPGTTSRWEAKGVNIWEMDLYDSSFTGVPNDLTDVYCNNIGCLYDYEKDVIHGNKVQYYKELLNNWDIWQTESFASGTNPAEFRYVYLYLDKDPNTLPLVLTTGTHAAVVQNAVVDGVNFKGFGFGLSAWSGSQIRNCKIDIVGGRTFIGYGVFCNYGNGIEFYVARDIENSIVEDCMISRCYDCGATIQASNAGRAQPRNIVFRNNLLINNCQGWEDFLRNDPDIVFEKCLFEDNIVLYSGESGFGYPKERLQYCHILGNNIYGPRYMTIRNNLFIGGNFYCSGSFNGEYKSNRWAGNKCYIEYGEFLLHDYWQTNNVIKLYKSNSSRERRDAISEYRLLTGDTSTQFIIKSSKTIEKLARKYEKRFLKNHKY